MEYLNRIKKMMKTPIFDFIKTYQSSGCSRLHMPGHKGRQLLGFEDWDITEIKGADELYDAESIIAESEANATALFGSGRTFYSTEGSSQCIRSMLFLALAHKPEGADEVILAARNVHKAYLYSAALLDFSTEWLWPEEFSSLCSCVITPNQLAKTLAARACPPAGVYITSPDYLGHVADVKGLAEVCHRFGTRLLVDNAHGAYLRFLKQSGHPMDLGADICCDSAHKTLPVLTGGAYLHLSEKMAELMGSEAKHAMAMFGSTSPSYLIMASLDRCNAYLSDGYETKLAACIERIEALKADLTKAGWEILPSDPLRVTIHAPEGMTGSELAEYLRAAGGECEYADPDDLVLMLTPENPPEDLDVIRRGLAGAKAGGSSSGQAEVISDAMGCEMEAALTAGVSVRKKLPLAKGRQVMSVRKAVWAPHEMIPAMDSLGRICAATTVACPPAIPIVVSGEVITEEALALFDYYHLEKVDVVKEVPMNRKEAAMKYFAEGYNCAQSVVLAFSDFLPAEDKKTIMKMSSSFGGGMGRLREVCGAVSGMFLIAGALYGYDGPETGALKAEHYQRIQDLAAAFEKANGSIVCRELLGLKEHRQDATPEARTEAYYKKRPCKELVGCAAEILEGFLE